MKARTYGFLLTALIGVTSTGTAIAAEPPVAGLVVWVTGSMKATMPSAAPRTLSRRSPIYQNDTITTDRSGSGEIVFADNSIVSLRNDTTLEIAKFKYQKGASSNGETLNLIKGGFRTLTGAITKENPEAYKANTPVATIGVAGTMYSAYYDGVAKNLFTKLDKGIVYVTNEAGKVTLSKSAPKDKSRCALDMYSKVDGKSKPTIICDLPDIFNTDPPVIPVNFPDGSGSGTVGSFCVSEADSDTYSS